MTFQMRLDTSGYYDAPTWVIEKTLTPGETYLVATFREEYRAFMCLDSLKWSSEVLHGAEVSRATNVLEAVGQEARPS